MCWNEQVSLNTFLFSGFCAAAGGASISSPSMIVDTLNSVWKIAFFASFISMQLVVEFFHLAQGNKYYNARTSGSCPDTAAVFSAL
jgi:hypothetical protein